MPNDVDVASAPVADACLRLGLTPRLAPPGLRPVVMGQKVSGRVVAVRHAGSVDVFLEALDEVTPGDVLVVDDGGRVDEACIGDQITLEAKHAGVAAIIVWGTHRDTAELVRIGLPVYSHAAHPHGPTEARSDDTRKIGSARLGDIEVVSGDHVTVDDDGAVFYPAEQVTEVQATAKKIQETEREQAAAMSAGRSLRAQLRFDRYLAERHHLGSFRDHLRAIGGEIEQ